MSCELVIDKSSHSQKARIAKEQNRISIDAKALAAARQMKDDDDDPDVMPEVNIAYGILKVPNVVAEEKDGAVHYPSVWVTIPLYRQPRYVLLTSFFPLFVLNLFSLSIFRIDRGDERSSRVATVITILLALFAFMPTIRQQAPIANVTFLDVCVIGSVVIMGFVMADSVFPPSEPWIFPGLSIALLAIGTGILIIRTLYFEFHTKPELDKFKGLGKKRSSNTLAVEKWHCIDFDPTKDFSEPKKPGKDAKKQNECIFIGPYPEKKKYRTRWDGYFDLLDVDGNGLLSADDIAGGVAVNS